MLALAWWAWLTAVLIPLAVLGGWVVLIAFGQAAARNRRADLDE